MQEIANFIGQIGFPIFVAVWMLYKSSKDSEEMRESIDKLEKAITTLTNEVAHNPTFNNEDSDE